MRHNVFVRSVLFASLMVSGVAHAAVSSVTTSTAGTAVPAVTLRPQPLSQTFGKKGQLVLQGLSGSAYGVNLRESGENAENGYFAVAGMRVGGMVKDRWLLGGALKLGVGGSGGVAAVGKVGPFVGFYQPIGVASGFMPSFELSYAFATGGSRVYNEMLAQLSFDFIFHQSEHFALTFGPTISQSLFGFVGRSGSGSSHATGLFYGVSLGMLGWK